MVIIINSSSSSSKVKSGLRRPSEDENQGMTTNQDNRLYLKQCDRIVLVLVLMLVLYSTSTSNSTSAVYDLLRTRPGSRYPLRMRLASTAPGVGSAHCYYYYYLF